MKESDILNGLILSLGRSEYSVQELIKLSELFSINDGSIRTWLSRQTKKGFLIKSLRGTQVSYGLSSTGRKISANVALSFKTPDWSNWDGSWWGFLFSIPEQKKHYRHRLRTKLDAYRFAPWYGGFWIRPRNDSENIYEHLNEEDKGRLLSFQAMKGITANEVRSMWGIESLQKSFTHAHESLKKEMKVLNDYSPQQAHLKRIFIGNEIVPLLFKDPLLPPQFLPRPWAGNILKEAFTNWDEVIREKARPFWQSVFN